MKTTTTATTWVLLWIWAFMSALGAEMKIKNVDDFIQFRDNVSSGTNYSGTTVFLDTDLSLAGKTFEPIGTSNANCFIGTFDGQGHAISNLAITSSSSQYVGLFGYSTGLTIRNVILDSSCSVTSTTDSGGTYVGGILGNCNTINGPCAIENSVNMGSVTFNWIIGSGYYLYLGGIAGYLSSSSSNGSTVKNCANYGDAINSGEGSTSFIGGIVGYSAGSSSSKRMYIYNCLNHGTITQDGTTYNYLYIGGIAGYAYYATIENCVSGGKYSFITKPSDDYIGGILGWDSSTTINFTYFTSDLSGYKKYGYLDSSSSESNTLSYDSTSFELNGTVSIGGYTGTSLIDALNAASDYNTTRDYSHWLLNKGSNVVTFTINKNSPFTMDTQIILLPSLASEGNMSFDGWYTDEGLTTPLTEFEVTSDTPLYGLYGIICFVAFYSNGGSTSFSSTKVIYKSAYGNLPEATRTGYTFHGWFTGNNEKITEESIVNTPGNHTLFARWTANNYAVTFNPSGGSISQSTKVVTFGSAYGELPTPNKTGHTFIGWFNEKNESVTEESIVKTPENHTLCAHWLEVRQNQVEIVFSTKDMSKDEIEEIIKKYTDSEFTITEIEDNRDETRVIVEFVDAEEAKKFFRDANAAIARGEGGKIKRVIYDYDSSFSSAYHPMNLLFLM